MSVPHLLDTLRYWAALNAIPGIRVSQFRAICAFFQNDLEKAFFASKETLSHIPGMTPSLMESLLKGSVVLRWADQEMASLQKRDIALVPFISEAYPPLLKQIVDYPPLLYIQGTFPKASLYIGIVGTRRATPYGLEVAEYLSRGLSKKGVTIVSGLARGIDRRAHEAALPEPGSTVAVVGNGLGVIYPREHRHLYEKIAADGALISEFPLATKPLKYNFPKRNRIISGLCHGLVVVEAPSKSGALITAEHGLEQGREIFCVPGRLNSHTSQGTHGLIQQGAKLITRPEDVLEEFQQRGLSKELTSVSHIEQTLSDKEKRIFDALEEAHDFGELVDSAGVTSDELSETLLWLEMKGLVVRKNHQYLRRLVWQNHS